ncbi:hypothetical protein B0H14DRAFT_3440994 [Mycena olivaceomarginata]|nr:hypothetical protein B0H14DRAFT_3440994 [Mycena olivaceomarginata]
MGRGNPVSLLQCWLPGAGSRPLTLEAIELGEFSHEDVLSSIAPYASQCMSLDLTAGFRPIVFPVHRWPVGGPTCITAFAAAPELDDAKRKTHIYFLKKKSEATPVPTTDGLRDRPGAARTEYRSVLYYTPPPSAVSTRASFEPGFPVVSAEYEASSSTLHLPSSHLAASSSQPHLVDNNIEIRDPLQWQSNSVDTAMKDTMSRVRPPAAVPPRTLPHSTNLISKVWVPHQNPFPILAGMWAAADE